MVDKGSRYSRKPCVVEGGSNRDGEKWFDTDITPGLDHRCVVNGTLLILVRHDLEFKTQEHFERSSMKELIW